MIQSPKALSFPMDFQKQLKQNTQGGKNQKPRLLKDLKKHV